MTSFKKAFSKPTKKEKQLIEEIKLDEQRKLNALGFSDEQIELGKKCYEYDYGNDPHRPVFVDYLKYEFSNWQLAFNSYKHIIKEFTDEIYNKSVSDSYDNIVEKINEEDMDQNKIALHIRKQLNDVHESLKNYVQ